MEAAKKEMGWLYSTPQVDREQYLLGKKIDRQVDPLLASEDREKQALASGPGALFVGSNSAGTTADLATKVKEDPLFLIKKKEEEAKKQLASNPVKMKQLQELLARKKHKSKKKRRHSPYSKRDHSHHRSSRKSHKDKKLSPPPSPSHKHPPPSRHQDHHHPPPSRHQDHHLPSRHHTKTRPQQSSGLSHEEMERRRKEMMADAERHGHDREQRLRKIEQDYKREQEDSVSHHSQDFLQPLRVQSVSAAGSVQERIQHSIGSVQRTHAAMDKHFLHK